MKIIHILSLSSALLINSVPCRPQNSISLRSKLATESKTIGLALVGNVGNRITVIPFDSVVRHFLGPYPEPVSMTYGKEGKTIAWQYQDLRKSLFVSPTLIIATVSGDPISSLLLPFGTPAPDALSEKARKIAFWTFASNKGQMTSRGLLRLCWRFFDYHSGGEITTSIAGDAGGMDWSPDGKELVYAKEQRIHIYNFERHQDRLVADGDNPSWTFDICCVAYRAKNGEMKLISTKDQQRLPPLQSSRAHLINQNSVER